MPVGHLSNHFASNWYAWCMWAYKRMSWQGNRIAHYSACIRTRPVFCFEFWTKSGVQVPPHFNTNGKTKTFDRWRSTPTCMGSKSFLSGRWSWFGRWSPWWIQQTCFPASLTQTLALTASTCLICPWLKRTFWTFCFSHAPEACLQGSQIFDWSGLLC